MSLAASTQSGRENEAVALPAALIGGAGGNAPAEPIQESCGITEGRELAQSPVLGGQTEGEPSQYSARCRSAFEIGTAGIKPGPQETTSPVSTLGERRPAGDGFSTLAAAVAGPIREGTRSTSAGGAIPPSKDGPQAKGASPATNTSDGLEWLRATLISATIFDVFTFASQAFGAAGEGMPGWGAACAVFTVATLGICWFGLFCVRPHSLADFKTTSAKTRPAKSPIERKSPKSASLSRQSGSGITFSIGRLLSGKRELASGVVGNERGSGVKEREIRVPNLFAVGE